MTTAVLAIADWLRNGDAPEDGWRPAWLIPESHRRGHKTHATFGVMTGFALMMVLGTALG